jgi:hypothetical protein
MRDDGLVIGARDYWLFLRIFIVVFFLHYTVGGKWDVVLGIEGLIILIPRGRICIIRDL